MIIGKFIVPPTQVKYGSMRYDPETNMTEVMICLDDDMQLSQWVSKADDVKRIMQQIDECTAIVAENDRAAVLGED